MVAKELDRLVSQDIIIPVESSDWAPIVPVLKADKTVRLCGDYRININPHLEVNIYPIPRVGDLLNSLGGAKVFSKLDLSQA